MKKILLFSIIILITISSTFGRSFYFFHYVYSPLERIDDYTKNVMGNLTCWSRKYKIHDGFGFRYERLYTNFRGLDFTIDLGTSYFLKNINCYNYTNVNINVDLFSLDFGISLYKYLTSKDNDNDFVLKIGLINLPAINRVNYNTSSSFSTYKYFLGYKLILSVQMTFLYLNENQILLDFGIYNVFSSKFRFNKLEERASNIYNSGLYIGLVFVK